MNFLNPFQVYFLQNFDSYSFIDLIFLNSICNFSDISFIDLIYLKLYINNF